jgi:hypothetical protein
MSVSFNFGQLSLNLTHCAAPQTGIKPGYPRPDSALKPFGSFSIAWFTHYVTLTVGKINDEFMF